jgi:UDP-N-acetylglucosamine acyltransferase
MIDPRAIVHPDARIGKNVHVGPFSIIGDQVEVGDNTWIGPHVVINGPTVIGADNKIHQFCSLGEAPQHVNYKGEPTQLRIGDRNVVREYCSFNRGTVAGRGVTEIGDDNFIMAYAHVAHDCVVGNRTIFANASSLAGHVEVGDYAILGGFTVVHQFCRIGAHCITGLGTVTFKDIPPFVVAAGNTATPHGVNVKGLQRRDFAEEEINQLRRAYKLVYKSGMRMDDALRELEARGVQDRHVALFADFIRRSQRGIIR